jgi:hypothetical protein
MRHPTARPIITEAERMSGFGHDENVAKPLCYTEDL